jgi:hypothetical protein
MMLRNAFWKVSNVFMLLWQRLGGLIVQSRPLNIALPFQGNKPNESI